MVYLLSRLAQLTWITTRCRVLVSTGLQSSNGYRQWCTHRPSRCHASLPNNAQAPKAAKSSPIGSCEGGSKGLSGKTVQVIKLLLPLIKIYIHFHGAYNQGPQPGNIWHNRSTSTASCMSCWTWPCTLLISPSSYPSSFCLTRSIARAASLLPS